jgi:hypothetical protein
MFETIICKNCGYEQEYDPDNDVLLCDKCEHLIFVPLPVDEPAKNGLQADGARLCVCEPKGLINPFSKVCLRCGLPRS